MTHTLKAIAVAILISSCSKDPIDTPISLSEPLKELQIPEGYNLTELTIEHGAINLDSDYVYVPSEGIVFERYYTLGNRTSYLHLLVSGFEDENTEHYAENYSGVSWKYIELTHGYVIDDSLPPEVPFEIEGGYLILM